MASEMTAISFFRPTNELLATSDNRSERVRGLGISLDSPIPLLSESISLSSLFTAQFNTVLADENNYTR